MPVTQRLPLSRFRVLDLTRARAGPAAVRQLADWGADVIMIETPDKESDITGKRGEADFENLHRNKRSVTLDLKTDEGRQAFYALARTADVIVENMRPAVKRRLKIDYDTIHEINPRLVYASISGFGQDGPYADRPGLDQIAQGMGGLMSVTGTVETGPMRAGIALSDMSAGVYCSFGILMALLEKEQTNVGRWVRTSLLQAQIAMLDFQCVRWLVDGEVPQPQGNHHPSFAPMGLFDTADGQVNLAAADDEIFGRFCKLIDRTDWLDDPKYVSARARFDNRDCLRGEVARVMQCRTSDEWIDACNAAGIPCGPIYSVDEMFADPQVKHLRMTETVIDPAGRSLELVAQPLEFSDERAKIRTAAPKVGEHTDEILKLAGYTQENIDMMRGKGVI